MRSCVLCFVVDWNFCDAIVSVFVRFSISGFFVGIGHANGSLFMNGVLCSLSLFCCSCFCSDQLWM